MTLFACTVPGVPVPQSRARTTKRGTFYGKRASAHRKLLWYKFRESWLSTITAKVASLPGPVSVLLEIAGARVSSDTDNHAKMVLDALVDAGVLASDDVRVVRELVVRVVDGEPRTRVVVTAA